MWPVKTLYVLRHAKSDWADASLADRDRPLARRGARAAAHVAAHVRRAGIRPALVLCSPARRACETLEAVRPALGAQAVVEVEDELYAAGAAELLARLRKVGANTGSVMLIGHNPGLEDLTVHLAGDGDATAISQLQRKFPTAALATIDLGPINWDELGPGRAYLESIFLPREPR
jgi:phosphohistidine phosphatase